MSELEEQIGSRLEKARRLHQRDSALLDTVAAHRWQLWRNRRRLAQSRKLQRQIDGLLSANRRDLDSLKASVPPGNLGFDHVGE